ncbi:MAG: hypothetical protein ACKO1O_03175 [Erythrobacter sp.]
MSLLEQLSNGLKDAGFDIRLEDDHIILLGESGENIGVFEIVGSWVHTQVFLGEAFDDAGIMTSLLLANDRVLGFRFSIDSSGYASARCEALVSEIIEPSVIRVIESMLESVPAYWLLFDRCRSEGRQATEAELDQIAENFERTLN